MPPTKPSSLESSLERMENAIEERLEKREAEDYLCLANLVYQVRSALVFCQECCVPSCTVFVA